MLNSTDGKAALGAYRFKAALNVHACVRFRNTQFLKGIAADAGLNGPSPET